MRFAARFLLLSFSSAFLYAFLVFCFFVTTPLSLHSEDEDGGAFGGGSEDDHHKKLTLLLLAQVNHLNLSFMSLFLSLLFIYFKLFFSQLCQK